MWPKRNKCDESNTINAIKEGDWGSVESVTISGNTYPYRVNIADTCDLSFLGTFKITCHDRFMNHSINFELKDIPSRRFYKAKLLWEQIFVMPRLQNIDNYKIMREHLGRAGILSKQQIERAMADMQREEHCVQPSKCSRDN